MGMLAAVFALLFFGGALGACEDDEAHGAAPYIDGLSYAPETLPISTVTTISGEFSFSDPDRDAGQIAFTIIGPDQNRQDIAPQEVPGLRGQSGGVVSFTLQLQPAQVGTHVFEVFLIDDYGFESNRLEGTFEVVAP
jgi:hypothetical protein